MAGAAPRPSVTDSTHTAGPRVARAPMDGVMTMRFARWQDGATELVERGVQLPDPRFEEARRAGAEQPRWVHIGGGNLYRAFHAEVAQDLIDRGLLDRGVMVMETFSPFTADELFAPYNNDVLQVVMAADGSLRERVLASTAAALFANPARPADFARARACFASPDLQLVTLTITEKGYVVRDEELGCPPDAPIGTMSTVASLLHARHEANAAPLALVSTDNFSRNGERFREAVLTVVRGWRERGLVAQDFVDYVADEGRVSFPWTMVDRITPNPSPEVAERLAAEGWEDLALIDQGRGASAAGFSNTEEARYLVVEDSFPNGRPALEEAGVIMCDRETAERADTMKVTACLNPLHTALAVYGCLLGYTRIWQEMENPDLVALVRRLGYDEDLPVVEDPGVIDPKAFIDELLERRLPNTALPDAPQRIATDSSQKIPIRYGHTLQAYLRRGMDVGGLTFIPLVIAGWLRYLVGVDDRGEVFEPSPDPLLETLQQQLAPLSLGVGDRDLVHKAVAPILSQPSICGIDLYEVGLGEKVERMLIEELAGPGAVASTLRAYVSDTTRNED